MINSCSLSGSQFLLSGHMWKLRLSYSLSFWAKPAPNHNQFTKYRTNRSKKMRSSSIEISTIGDDESGILPSISFCTNMQTEVSLVNLSLTRFNNVLLRSPLKLLVTHLTRWKLSHYFHQLFKKKRKKKTNIKGSWYNNLSPFYLTPLFMNYQRLSRTSLSILCSVAHVSVCLMFPSS